jgi:Phosphotransferase enzyme family
MHLTHGFWPGRQVTAAGAPPSHRLDAWDRLAYLDEICALLWPSSAAVTLDSASGGGSQRNGAARPGSPREAYREGREFILIPGPWHPRLLVPTAAGASAAAMRHYGQPRSATGRAVQRSLALGLACGLGGKLLGVRVRVDTTPDADSIEAYLQRVLGREFRVSVRLGPARANRKPVLELVTSAGEPVGFAKIGFNPLTRDLVRAERASLEWLNRAGLSGVIAPQVVHHGQWHDLDVLVVSALPVWQRRRPVTAARLSAAMDSVGRLGGLRHGPRPAEAYLQNLRARLSGAKESPERQALHHALDALTIRVRGADLTFGACHGDWTPWNMASTGRALLVWDWERFTVGAPFGFDALHYWLQKEVVVGRRDRREAAADCLAYASQLLAPFGTRAAEARVTAALYLADLAIRHLADRQSEAGARFGAPGAWLIPALSAEVARQSASQNGSC